MKVFNRNLSDVFEKLHLKAVKKSRKIYCHSIFHLNRVFSKSKCLKILAVFDRSCNIRYLEDVLLLLKAKGQVNHTIVNLDEYLKEDESKYDLLIYQTWSTEKDYAIVADKKFLKSKLPKVLFDAHASGSIDTYERFNDPQIPRIKNAPHVDFLKSYNVILKTTHPVDPISYKKKKREVDISYCLGLKTHELRPKVYDKVSQYKNKAIVDLNFQHNYIFYLRRVKLSINMPGYGEGSFRHLYSFNAATCVLAHDSIEPICLLPYANLEMGRDYISFNLDNFDEKINWCLNNPKRVEEIALNGYNKFKEGYNIKRAALELYPILLDIFQAR